MFHVIEPRFFKRYGRNILEWYTVVSIEAPSPEEAIRIAKRAGHPAPILDDHRTDEQRERDINRFSRPMEFLRGGHDPRTGSWLDS